MIDIKEILETFAMTYMAIQGSTDDVDLIDKEQEKLLDQTEKQLAEQHKEEIDQLRVQLAGCGVAALGYAKDKNDVKKGDYGWSQSFQDVKDLWDKYIKLTEQHKKPHAEYSCCYTSHQEGKKCPIHEQHKKPSNQEIVDVLNEVHYHIVNYALANALLDKFWGEEGK